MKDLRNHYGTGGLLTEHPEIIDTPTTQNRKNGGVTMVFNAPISTTNPEEFVEVISTEFGKMVNRNRQALGEDDINIIYVKNYQEIFDYIFSN